MRVLLLSLPWAPPNPSVQLGLLVEAARALPGAPVQAATYHGFLPFLAALGPAVYDLLATDAGATRVANAVVLRRLTGDERPAGDLLTEGERAALAGEGIGPEALRGVAAGIDDGFDRLRDALCAALGPGDVLACSCVFHQLYASLAVSRELSDRVPGLRVVLGGAEVQGAAAPEVLRRFSWVDAVVRGRGERPFASLLRRWRDEAPGETTPGVVCRGDGPGEIRDGGVDTTRVDFGAPDYGEFFSTLAGLGLPPSLVPGVPVEASQGCGWGRCDFCGTDELVGGYRVRPAPSLGAEIRRVVATYESLHVVFTDEEMPPAVVRRALDGLPEEPWRRHLVFGGQGRADVRREHLAQLADRGLRLLQLGVESFSTALLARMRKGVTGLQNLRCLRWCAELGIEVDYNLILGHPCYDDETLDAMTALFPRLHHLPPPRTSDFFVNRYAPLFRDGTLDELGLATRPSELTCADLFPELLAGFPFVALVLDRPETTPAGLRLLAAIRAWRAAWRPDLLSYVPYPRGLVIVDARGGKVRRLELRGTMAETLLACDDPIAPADLVGDRPPDAADRISAAVDELLARGLLVEEAGLLLNVVPRQHGRAAWASV